LNIEIAVYSAAEASAAPVERFMSASPIGALLSLVRLVADWIAGVHVILLEAVSRYKANALLPISSHFRIGGPPAECL
jgi:hypothetical protein